MSKTTTVGLYLIARLEEAGIKHVFGIPGDYVLSFYDLLLKSSIRIVGTCNESGAGFAADAYARVNGLGAICVTYAVGGLNTLNAVAGAYAEKSPVILISGAPGLGERAEHPLLHHCVRDYDTQRQIFEKVTVAAVSLEDPAIIPQQIDETIAECIRHKRPVYIELPRDMVHQPCAAPREIKTATVRGDPAILSEALDEAAAMLKKARRPAILAGVEIHRFGLQEQLMELVKRSGYPVAATLLGKSVMSERHPQYIGVYEGAMGRETTRRRIEEADCLLILGAFMTDINLGVYTAKLDVSRTIYATSERLEIKRHKFENVVLREFISGLARRLRRRRGLLGGQKPKPTPFRVQPKRKITVRRFFARMNDFLDDDTIVISDVGDSLFGAADLTIHRRTEFLSPAYYTSMGFAVPAALGAQVGKPRLRPIVFVGDGAFQMTGQEVSSIASEGLNPIIFVLNNKGYTTERYINEGPYNDIPNWEYHRLTEIIGQGYGAEVKTEGDLEEALKIANANTKSLSMINVHLDKLDRSDALERLGRRLKKQGGLEKKRVSTGRSGNRANGKSN